MSLIAISQIPKFVRERIIFIPDPPSKRELSAQLTSLIQDFFSNHELHLNNYEVIDSYSDIPVWRIDTVLAKLRSLLEQKAKKEIRIFCSQLDQKRIRQTKLLLKKAAIYKFRDAIDLDLYVGVHTAISAYFKMLGLALVATSSSKSQIPILISSKELFRALRFIATLPLRHLMAFDGLFWDSKQYTIPQIFSFEIHESQVNYFLPVQEIENRLKSALADEEQTGCPALRAKTLIGESVFDLVENYCVECVQEFFLDYKHGFDKINLQ